MFVERDESAPELFRRRADLDGDTRWEEGRRERVGDVGANGLSSSSESESRTGNGRCRAEEAESNGMVRVDLDEDARALAAEKSSGRGPLLGD
ncbi:hypothetical protein FS749_012701 [Ceratobasidium sp. UAMH 11750]|nr:hypothetical protein FS749_012701 [Ceratobasidium sp. UAMH 11750]